MNLLFGSGPKPTTVASSPSPYPSCAFPAGHPPSAKPTPLHAVPWFDPLSRYFHCEPKPTSVVLAVLLLDTHTDTRAWAHKKTTNRRIGHRLRLKGSEAPALF